MRVRSIAILAAMLALPVQAYAEPAPEAKPQPLAAEATDKPATQLASAADVLVAPEPAKISKDAPVKKRAARVTTCRCGGEPTPR